MKKAILLQRNSIDKTQNMVGHTRAHHISQYARLSIENKIQIETSQKRT